jgi:hypothetical protein
MFINWDMKGSGALCFRKFERNNTFAFSPGAIRARPPLFFGNVIYCKPSHKAYSLQINSPIMLMIFAVCYFVIGKIAAVYQILISAKMLHKIVF